MSHTPSDSELIGDISTFSDIPDSSVQLDELNADVKDTSEELSSATEKVLTEIAKEKPDEQLTDHQSLSEFEEIERLIKENTALDSDDEEDTTEISEKEATAGNQLYQDTGYQSGQYRDDQVSSSWKSHENTDENDEEISEHLESASPTLQNEENNMMHSASQSSHASSHQSQSPVWFPEHSAVGISINDTNTDLDVTLERFLAPESPVNLEHRAEDDEEKLVATFGTTEKFEALLEKQLQNMEEEDVHSAEERFPRRSSDADMIRHEEQKKEKTYNRQTDDRTKRRLTQRTTRSPAANRVKRVRQRSGVGRIPSQSSFHESSDDLSVRSDASRSELRRRLKKENRSRKKDTEVVKQLQTDYDDLLTRYAEAENVIDQLRIGAKIDLFAQLPTSGHSNDFAPAQPGVNAQTSLLSDRPLSDSSSRHQEDATSIASQNMDPLTESSLQLPFVASAEILRSELQMKARELKEQIESFKALLQNGGLADAEKHQALRNIEESLRNLERDYSHASRDHESEKRRSLVFGRGMQIPDAHEEFDPQHTIEGEVCRLGRMVDDLKDNISYSGSLPQTPISFQRSSATNFSQFGQGYQLSTSETSDDDVDGEFSELLKRYPGRSSTIDNDEAHTTAPSVALSTDQDFDDFQSDKENDSQRRGNVSALPERYFQPNSALSDKSPESTPSPKERKSIRTMSPNKSASFSPPQKQSRSKLPRPVGSRSSSTPDHGRKNQQGHEFEADSGFMGSESSRQSVSTAPLAANPQTQIPSQASRNTSDAGKRSTTKPRQKKPMLESSASKVSQRKPHPQHTRQMTSPMKATPMTQDPSDSRNKNKMVPASASMTNLLQPKKENESMEESDADISTSSTVQELLNPLRKSTKPLVLGSSGSPMLSHNFKRDRDHERKSAGSEKSRASSRSRRSVGSSSKDSTLDLIRGEIAKLRAEIRESKTQEQQRNLEPKLERRDLDHDQNPNISGRTGRSDHTVNQTRRKAEDDTAPKHTQDYSQDPHLRASSLTRLNSNEENIRPSSPMTHPQYSTTNGHWAYISPIGVHYPYPVTPAVASTPIVYTPQPLLPTARANTMYLTPPKLSPARIYVPVTSPVQVAYTTDATHKERVTRYPSGRGRRLKKASLYIVSDDDDDDDIPLSRSQLSPIRRRSYSVPRQRAEPLDSRLSISLRRAEKASDDLRYKSNTIYRSLRDSLYKAELMTETI